MNRTICKVFTASPAALMGGGNAVIAREGNAH
jgi:hypothetical protein